MANSTAVAPHLDFPAPVRLRGFLILFLSLYIGFFQLVVEFAHHGD